MAGRPNSVVDLFSILSSSSLWKKRGWSFPTITLMTGFEPVLRRIERALPLRHLGCAGNDTRNRVNRTDFNADGYAHNKKDLECYVI